MPCVGMLGRGDTCKTAHQGGYTAEQGTGDRGYTCLNHTESQTTFVDGYANKESEDVTDVEVNSESTNTYDEAECIQGECDISENDHIVSDKKVTYVDNCVERQSTSLENSPDTSLITNSTQSLQEYTIKRYPLSVLSVENADYKHRNRSEEFSAALSVDTDTLTKICEFAAALSVDTDTESSSDTSSLNGYHTSREKDSESKENVTPGMAVEAHATSGDFDDVTRGFTGVVLDLREVNILDLSEVNAMMKEVRSGSSVSDCTEDSGIGTESLSPKHASTSTPATKHGRCSSKDGLPLFNFTSISDMSPISEINNNKIDATWSTDTSLNDVTRNVDDMCDHSLDFYDSGVSGLYNNTDTLTICQNGYNETNQQTHSITPYSKEIKILINDQDLSDISDQESISVDRRPPHIIPAGVRKIMDITSQISAMPSILRRRRNDSSSSASSRLSNRRSWCSGSLRTPPPPSFPAPPTPQLSRLLSGDIPPPSPRLPRQRSFSNRSSWCNDSVFTNSSSSSDSSRSASPTPSINHVTSNHTPSTPTRCVNDSTMTNYSVPRMAATQRGPRPSSGLWVKAVSSSSSPRPVRRSRSSCSALKPHIKTLHQNSTNSQTTSSKNDSISNGSQPNGTCPSYRQAVETYKPVISGKSLQRLPDDHRLREYKSDGGDIVQQKANKMQLELLRSKKIIEKDLSERLDEQMEQQDNLVGIMKRSMVHTRPKHQVMAANREVKKVIHSEVITDPDTNTKYHKISINLGNYCCDVQAKVVNNLVKISGKTPKQQGSETDTSRLQKEIDVEFSASAVNVAKLDVLQMGDQVIIGVPFWSSKDRVPAYNSEEFAQDRNLKGEVMDNTDYSRVKELSNDTIEQNAEYLNGSSQPTRRKKQRIAYLESLYKSLQLNWPPLTPVHYEYMSGNYVGDNSKHECHVHKQDQELTGLDCMLFIDIQEVIQMAKHKDRGTTDNDSKD